MEGISPKTVEDKDTDDKFINNTANFSVELFKKSIGKKQNTLISPLSVLLALSMTANGADNETLTQMQAVLGEDIPIEERNEYLYGYVKSLPNEEKQKLSIANSIWFRGNKNRFTVEKDFLQTNANYYNAAAYESNFDQQTVKDINYWVKTKTDGMVDKILEDISDSDVMYLINAITFDAEWETIYQKNEIYKDDFTALKGSKQTVDFMCSKESTYLDDGKATGFIKPYAKNKYSFVALLPNENISISDYIKTLSGESLIRTINEAQDIAVNATLPKFSYDYSIKMNDALKVLGMSNAFSEDKADFRKIGKSSDGNIFISEVIHKTLISVDELGTKAGAATAVRMEATSAPFVTKTVKLDRPFVYAIIDNATNLPLFIGTTVSIEK
jgi:serpin B